MTMMIEHLENPDGSPTGRTVFRFTEPLKVEIKTSRGEDMTTVEITEFTDSVAHAMGQGLESLKEVYANADPP